MSDEKKPKGLLLVQMDVDPSDEAELNAWYEEEHLPERVNCKGFLTGRRFQSIDGAPKYLALYDLESIDVLDWPEYQELMQSPTPRTKAVGAMLRQSSRKVYVEIERESTAG
jgi:hypothetical protein